MEATRDQAQAVQRMLDAIEQNLERQLTLEQLANRAGYSPYHASRLFKALVGVRLSDYVRSRRLSHAALKLRDTEQSVSNVALDSAFDSHEGFTRAFSRQFGHTPSSYRESTPPLALFEPRSPMAVYLHRRDQQEVPMQSSSSTTVFVHVLARPTRTLVMQRGSRATDYWGYCEEVGCNVWGLLSSLNGALDEPLGLWLPEHLRRPGTSEYVMGVEMPSDFETPLPEGLESVRLEPAHFLVFQGQPYEPDQMGPAIRQVQTAMAAYDPGPTGFRWDDDAAPRFQKAPLPERGYIEGRPVARI